MGHEDFEITDHVYINVDEFGLDTEAITQLQNYSTTLGIVGDSDDDIIPIEPKDPQKS
jgi:hypothetical protein